MTPVANIKSLTDFLRNSKKHIEQLRQTHEPELLTVNGEAAVVVQEATAYEKMANLARQAAEDERLSQALLDLRAGRGEGLTLETAMDQLRAKYGQRDR